MAALCDESDKSSPVPIEGVDPHIFSWMLLYIYGGKIRADEWKVSAKDFIDAADRYGVKTLKIEAEAWYVKYLKITKDNVVDTLVYAEQKNCFLLKEAATNFIMNHAQEVLESDAFENIPNSASVMREMVSLIAIYNRQGDIKKDLDDPAKLSINELRAKLYHKGEDFDGPRKRLIAQLSEFEPYKKRLKPSEEQH